MILYLVGGVLAAILLMLLLQWWSDAETSTARNSLLVAIIAVCALLSLGLIAAGKGLLALLPSGYALLRLAVPIAKHIPRSGKAETRSAAQRSGMDRQEALDILGLDSGASRDMIVAKHRKLIAQIHPDKGGSDWMAAKLNEAKRVLLEEGPPDRT